MNKTTMIKTAKKAGLTSCLQCGKLVGISVTNCPVCLSSIAVRKKNSLSKTWALLITAVILFIPANLLPMMTTTSIVGSQSDTIISGIIHLWQADMYPIAIIVFMASFVTPIFKMLSIAYLCYTCQIKSTKRVHFRSRLYHFNEMIGRWSMIDVFVVALLGALVQMGALATISPGAGIVAFACVVSLTMFAATSFDPRLIWDEYNNDTRN